MSTDDDTTGFELSFRQQVFDSEDDPTLGRLIGYRTNTSSARTQLAAPTKRKGPVGAIQSEATDEGITADEQRELSTRRVHATLDDIADELQDVQRLLSGEDLRELAVTGVGVERKFERLWAERANRNDEWVKLLNAVQLSLRATKPELWTREIVAYLADLVKFTLRPDALDQQTYTSELLKMEEAGLDPFSLFVFDE